MEALGVSGNWRRASAVGSRDLTDCGIEIERTSAI
jgi:hypothetical protein